MSELSIPPDRNAPSGTSATICCETASRNSASSSLVSAVGSSVMGELKPRSATLRADQEAANQASLCSAQVPLAAVSPWLASPASSVAALRGEVEALYAAEADCSTKLQQVERERESVRLLLREKQVALAREERRLAALAAPALDEVDATSRRLSSMFSAVHDHEPMDCDEDSEL